MRRREFIVGAGAAAAMPLAARTQQGERLRRIGVLHSVAFEDLSAQRNAALIEELARLGWADGRNVRIDLRNSASAAEVVQHAKDLIALAPDVIVVGGSAALGALQGVTRTVPIVFALVPDPVGGGFIDSLARPGWQRDRVLVV